MNGQFMPIEGEEGSLRDQFHRFANARENPQTLAETNDYLVSLLAETPEQPDKFCFNEMNPNTDEAAVKLLPTPQQAHAGLIAFHAPLALIEGSWLQSVALAGNQHKEPAYKLFACYLAMLGYDESDSPAFAYRGWMNQKRISLPDPSSWRFAHNPRVGASALHFANVQLALGMHSASFLPETLGFTLAYMKSKSCWRLAALKTHRRDAILTSFATLLNSALQTLRADSKEFTRACKGFVLYKTIETDYLAKLNAYANGTMSLDEQVGEIFLRKRTFARGYHAKVNLGGRGLEEWFAETPFDMAGFLEEFAHSSFAKTREGGRLFDQLTGFGGPMFGVFDKHEMTLINAWLDKAEAKQDAFVSINQIAHTLKPTEPTTQVKHGQVKSRALPFLKSIDNRKLFHLLVNQDFQPSTLTAAQQRVEKTLAQTRFFLRDKHPNDRFFEYSPTAFTQRILQIHDTGISQFKPLQGEPSLRREEYIWAIRQFAPAILVDGCWLQHLGEAAEQGQRKIRLLQRIHAEELGEGKIEWNHPKIYRDLLNDLTIELPPLDSLDFAYHASLLDTAFDLPSFLLAIAQFPKTYLPELLGLNLAIELSGLGTGYMRLAEGLRHWKINPLIVTLHLSIDNLAGGHAAMACEAIQLHMDEVLSCDGEDYAKIIWHRIWNGYRSLEGVTYCFRLALILGFLRRFMPQRLLSFSKNRYNSIQSNIFNNDL